jgi:chromosome segregation ATPase
MEKIFMTIVKTSKISLLSLSLLVAYSPVHAKQELKCWTNNDGIYECGNYIPPQYSQQGYEVYDEQGRKVKEIERALTAEEIAAEEYKKEEEKRRQEQEKEDQALLALFSTERDIELARTAVLNTIDGQINGIETILEGLRGNKADLEDSYRRSKDNPAVTESQLQAIQRDIESVTRRIKDTEATLQAKQKERQQTNEKYDIYLSRYRDITRRRGNIDDQQQSQ